MKRRAVTLLLGLAASIAACSKHSGQACKRDSDCDSDQVCFVDGCGDPARDIRVEVTPSSSIGRYAQDLAIDEVRAHEDLQVPSPAILEGSINTSGPNPPDLTSSGVAIRAQGESELIPGVLRSFESTLHADLQNGSNYSLPVSSGIYSVVANTLDVSPFRPPLFNRVSTTLRSGTFRLDLLFATAPTYAVQVQLSVPSPGTEMQIQALSDAVTLRPLSQRVTVPTGAVTLVLSPTVFQTRSFVVQATPKDPSALVPQKTFPPVVVVDNPPLLSLDMGAYGSPVEVSGTVVTLRGEPIANATVYVEGVVGGGGIFRSPGVLSDSGGNFSLTTLRSAPNGTSTLWAIPPAQSSSGILKTAVAVTAPSAIGVFPCPDKVLVQGSLSKADGSAAPGVRVVAVPVEAVLGKPLPANGGQTATNDDSSFSIKLDPATYRLDFIPGEQLPRVSRFVTVTADADGSGGFKPLQLSDFNLSNGRRITGIVYAFADPSDAQATVAPSASLRFFRLINFQGRQSSVLLAETVSDGRGFYRVTLPTR